MKRLVLVLALSTLPAIAQTPAPTQPRPPGPAPDYNAGGLPRTPTYGTIEGQPIDARTPEKKADLRSTIEKTKQADMLQAWLQTAEKDARVEKNESLLSYEQRRSTPEEEG